MTQFNSSSTNLVDPLVTFQAAVTNNDTSSSSSSSTAVTSLCFLGTKGQELAYDSLANQESVVADEEQEDDNDNDGDSNGSSEEEFAAHFRQSTSTTTTTSKQPLYSSSTAQRLTLDGVRLATCDFQGNVLLWDVASSTVVGNLLQEEEAEQQQTTSSTRGPGLALRRIHGSRRLLYHSRDPQGTVSLHDIWHTKTITSVTTQSHTFCAAAPCRGNANLVALPSVDDSHVTIRDWRAPSPVACFAASSTGDRKHGMLTSLSMMSENGTNVLLCGMEDGTLFLHDWTMARTRHEIITPLTTLSLGTDPILTLDVSPSPVASLTKTVASLVCLAGLAGDAAELSQADPSDRGRIAIVKASSSSVSPAYTATWQCRIRQRIGTATTGKPGVAVCQFRPDGRLFAAGGWDKRVRIFHRDGRALTILRGHDESIQALDWSPNAHASGLMASASSDGRICVWRCFGTN